MDCVGEYHYEDVPAKLLKLIFFCSEDLPSNKEADSDRREIDDPGCDPHHHDADTIKEIEDRLGLLPTDGDGDPSHYAEDDESQLGFVFKLKQTNKDWATSSFRLRFMTLGS